MRGIRAWFYRFIGLFNKDRLEKEMAEEIESNLQMHIEENLRQGMTPEEARRVALIRLGGIDRTKEHYRRRLWIPAFETFTQDLRYGARFLLNNRGLTIVATIVLALGIGANSAIFSIVNGVLLKPLPYHDQGQLVWIWGKEIKTGEVRTVSYPDFKDWQTRNHVFSHMAVVMQGSYTLTGSGEPQHVKGWVVSSDLFPLLGIPPIMGRTFTPEEDEDRDGKGQVAILTAQLWRRQFGSDPKIIGKTIVVGNAEVTVVGVMPSGFRFLFGEEEEDADLWLPLGNKCIGQYAIADQTLLSSDKPGVDFITSQRGTRMFFSIARLRPGITLNQAQTEVDAIDSSLRKEYPSTNENQGVYISTALEPLVGDSRMALLVIFAAVGCVLLISCGNVANLLLARGLARQREIAIRCALGAGRLRITRQLLTESLLLSMAGCAFGLLIAYWSIHFIVKLVKDLPRAKEVSLDGRVLAFTVLVSLITGLIFGLVPALQVSRVDLAQSFKEGGNSTAGIRGGKLRATLIVAEVALTLVLLTGSGLLLRTFIHLRSANTGFQTNNVLVFHFDLPDYKYNQKQQIAFQEQAVQRLESIPGIKSAATAFMLPLTGIDLDCAINLGDSPNPKESQHVAKFTSISAHYFRALGIPLLKGREFNERDDMNSAKVLIISQEVAKQLFPNGDALGKSVRLSSDDNEDENKPTTPRAIIGIVGDVKQEGVREKISPVIYIPSTQLFVGGIMLVHTISDPTKFLGPIKDEIRKLDPNIPIYGVQTFDQSLADTMTIDKFSTLLVSIFAGLALFLTGIGLYGVLSYSVTQRTREIGIRMALGAQQNRVLNLVVWQGMKLAVIGIVIGLIGAFLTTRLMASLLFEVKATDPVTMVLVTLMIAATVFVACLVPAWRAVRVDPLVALRCE